MSDALVIRLRAGASDSSIEYLLVDATGGRLGAVLSGTLAQAAPLAANRRVIVLVPGAECLCAEPELPAKNAARLLQLAPYALEEQLATEIDAMHFAVGKRTASGKTPVVAVPRARMEGWLAQLRAAGIEPDALYAESSVIPGAATLAIDEGRVYVQRPQAPGLTIDVQPLQEALDLALGEEGEAHVLNDPELYVTQSDYDTYRAQLEALRVRLPGLQIKLLPEGPLPLFALQAANGSAVNLLCGPYQRKSSLVQSFAPWRYAAILAGIAMLLHLGFNGLRLAQSIRAERELDRQIRQLAAQALPGVNLRDTREARKQAETRLNALRAGGGSGELLSSLGVLSEALAQTPEMRVEAMQYRAQTVDVRVLAPSVDALDKVQQAASAAGLTTKINAATPRDDKIEGRLQFKAGA